MNQIEKNLIDSLNRINFIFKNQEILTECIKNFDVFNFYGEEFGPFEKGKKYSIKFFIAKPLIEENILKIDLSKKCDHIDVQRYAIAERDNQQLIKQNEALFMNKIREARVFMEKDVKDKIKTKKDLDIYNSFFTHLLEGRLLKILRLAKTRLSVADEQKLTRSEKVIFNSINHLILSWKNFFLITNK
ncbi:MAG: hypothetical protein ACTSR8_01370 [Promethearchaeota archaeon]